MQSRIFAILLCFCIQSSSSGAVVELRSTLNTKGTRTIAFNPISKLLALWRKDGTVRIVDITDGHDQATLVLDHKKPVTMHFTYDGLRLLITDSKMATLWDARLGRKLSTFTGIQRRREYLSVADVKWSPNGKTILSLIIKTRRDEEETTVQLWDVDSGRLKFEVNVKGYGLTQFSPNGEQLLTYSGREDARLWDVETGRLIATLDPPQGSIAHRSYGTFSPDGRLLAIHSDERGIYIWDAVSGVLKTTVLEERKSDNCSLLGFSPNSKLLAVSREQLKSLPPTYSIELRDVVSGALRATLRGDNMKDAASQMLWSSDSQTLITAGGSQKYEGRIWDVKTGQLKTTFPMVAKESWIPMTFGYSNLDSLSVHPTLPVISAANYKFVRFWDLGTGELIQKIENTGSAVWSADGKLLLTFTSDVNTTQIWQVVSPPTSID